MSHRRARQFFGPYQLVRELPPSDLADRWLALHVRRLTSHVVHRFRNCRDRVERRRFLAAFEALERLRHPHILRVEQFSFGSAGRGWMVTPYTGSHDGLLTLASLLELKGGRLGEFEAERVIGQLLDASALAAGHGHVHGPITMDELLVDRSGSVLIEHYGLRVSLMGTEAAGPDLFADEVRSIAEIGYRAMTGLGPGEPLIRPSRVIKRVDRRWDDFFTAALDAGGGFACAADAIEALPTNLREQERDRAGTSPVRVVLGRFRRPVEPL